MDIPHLVYLSMDILVISTFSLFWTMLLWSLVCAYLFESLFLILWDIYIEVELMDHVIIICLIFRGTTLLFHSSYNILHSHQRCTRIPVLTNTCFLGFVCLFFIRTNLEVALFCILSKQMCDLIEESWIFTSASIFIALFCLKKIPLFIHM